MKIGIYEIENVQAVAASAGDSLGMVQDAVMIHMASDKFHDGDCILFGYAKEDFETEQEITDALNNNTPV